MKLSILIPIRANLLYTFQCETPCRSKCVSRPLFQNQFSKQMEIKVNYKRKPFLSSAVLTEKMTNWIKDNHLEILTKTYVIYNYNR